MTRPPYDPAKKLGTAPGGWKHDRRTRQERGYGADWMRARKVIIQRDMALCQPCRRAGRVTPFTEVDHIKPKCQGGTDDHENLELICTNCHGRKTEKEAAAAQGRRVKPRIALDGWPEE